MASGLLGCVDLRLPNELTLLVIDHLADDRKALCQLAQTCRGLQHLSEERIYKTIELLSVKDLHAIIHAFTRRRDRVRAVQVLKILYQYLPGDLLASEDVRKTFNDCLPHMVNLRQWHIESPFDNFDWEKAGGQEWVQRDMERFRSTLESAGIDGPKEADRIIAERRLGKNSERTIGLALLEQLTIHSHGANEDFWRLDGFDCLFRHPNLRHLHVSCISFPADEIPSLRNYAKKTPLTTLIFDECELDPKSLLSILSTPARLKNLTLGENVFNVNRSRSLNPRLTKLAGASFQALAEVAPSLERLVHLNPSWRTDFSPRPTSTRPPGDGLRNFHSLKFLECDTSSFLHQAAIMNRDLAPPNLEILRLRRHWEQEVDFWDQTPDVDVYQALPSLSTLELLQSTFIWFELSLPDYICHPERLRNRHACGYKLFKAGINLKVSIELHRDPHLIPPYLHGELRPVEHCMYDASLIGFRRHISNEPAHEHEWTCPHHLLALQSSDITTPLIISTDARVEPHSNLSEQTSMSHASSSTEPPEPATTTTAEPPETDKLGTVDINQISADTRSALQNLKHNFIRQRRRNRPNGVLSFFGEEPWMQMDEEEDEDDDEDEDDSVHSDDDELTDGDDDFEYILAEEEGDGDGVGHGFDFDGNSHFEDEDGIQLVAHNGQLYIEMYQSGSDDDDDDEDVPSSAAAAAHAALHADVHAVWPGEDDLD